MKNFFLALGSLFSAAVSTMAAAPWHHPFAVAMGGVWKSRASVVIQNRSDLAAAGELVETAVPELAGTPIPTLRVCDEAGHELLFDVRDGSGGSKRTGALAADDHVVLPIECGPHAKATLYIYASNEAAIDPGEYLPVWFVNGGFEQGKSEPLGWKQSETDPAHRVIWAAAGGRNGGHCGKLEVDEGAEAKWTKWAQEGMRVAPGTHYRVSGWVKAQDVKGEAGWFLHVHGDKPMILQSMLRGGSGTYDWKQVSFEFTAPPEARTATFGTVLHGAGTAWFDDAEFVVAGASDRWQVRVSPVEHLNLKTAPGDAPARFSDEWPARTVVRALNLAEREAAGVVVVDLRAVLAKLREIPRGAILRVVDAATGEELPAPACSGDSALFSATLPARSERVFHIYFNARRRETHETQFEALGRLIQSPVNLAPNPGFEAEGDKPRHWILAGSGHIISPGFIGKSALELNIPPSDKPAWSGWHSDGVPIEAGATYFYAAFVQSQKLVGRAQLHIHLHDASGKPTPSNGMQSSSASVTGDSDWKELSAFVETAPEAATAILHLTTNGTGTLRHDGVLFCRAVRADVVRIENPASVTTGGGLRVWEVNPLIKIFPDTPPGPPAAAVSVECARNEYEPFELVLRSNAAVDLVEASVSPLKNDAGTELPAVRVERVGFVPIDHPSSYFRFDGPEWHRPIPNGEGATDGWAGEWPDPLIPNGPFALAPGRAQPLWFTIRAPREAAPGEYRGVVEIRPAWGKTIRLPLTVRVLPFELPQRTKLSVIFDMHFGGGGDYGAGGPPGGEMMRKWYRLLADHRIGINMTEPPPVFSYKDGKVTMDATAFDETARYCFDDLGMQVSYLPQFFYSFGWAYPAKSIFGIEPFTPEFNSAFKQAYKLITDHIRERGWHDRFVYYVSDEPHFDHPFVIEQIKKLCTLAHETDPAIPIYSSTWTHLPEWDNDLDIWGAGHHGCFPVADFVDLQKRGHHLWFTTDGQMAIDTPYLATERTFAYYCQKYGVEGFEFWCIAWWSLDPWTHGWHSFIRQSPDGKLFYSTRYPNGDGYLTYPGESVGVSGPVSSIRLEEIREGIEDYEALSLLTRLADEARKAGHSSAEGERALAAAHDLVTIPNSSGLRSSENLPDPDKLPAARKLVNAAIVSLMKR